MQLTARQLRLLELALILATACYEEINENIIEDDEKRSLPRSSSHFTRSSLVWLQREKLRLDSHPQGSLGVDWPPSMTRESGVIDTIDRGMRRRSPQPFTLGVT